MADQIAPSLATALEQAALYADTDYHAELFTRAAALARAAEKVADARSREQIASTIQELRALVSGKGE